MFTIDELLKTQDIDEDWLKEQGMMNINVSWERFHDNIPRFEGIYDVPRNITVECYGEECEVDYIRVYFCDEENDLQIYHCTRCKGRPFHEIQLLKAQVYSEEQLCVLVNMYFTIRRMDIRFKLPDTAD